MKVFVRQFIVAALFVLSPAVAQAPNDCRIAIIIGNAAYPTAPLVNPANDAKSMAVALRRAGFEVFEVRDAGKAQMEDVIARAGAALKGRRGVGMFYYAGHGLQLDLHDYLVPVDAKLTQSADVPTQAIDLQIVIDAFKAAGNRTNILVLDACRDSPFAENSTGKGLAPIDAPVNAPTGTFLAYATAPGNVADDGDASTENGLYTQYLVSELSVAGARIEDVFKRVQVQVRRKSAGRQVPWDSSSLEDEFSFDLKQPTKQALDRERQFAIEKADWDRIKSAETAAPLYEYLLKYPNGLISEQVQFRLDQLEKPRLDIQVRDETAKALRSGTNRYAVGDELVYEITDALTGLTQKPIRRVITSADDIAVVVNGGDEVWDQMGGLIKNARGVRSPAVMLAPAEIWLGKRWTSSNLVSYGGNEFRNFSEFRVVGFEDMTIPAGSFKAYRIESNVVRSWGSERMKLWLDPRTMLIIKRESLFRYRFGIAHEIEQLVSYRPAPR